MKGIDNKRVREKIGVKFNKGLVKSLYLSYLSALLIVMSTTHAGTEEPQKAKVEEKQLPAFPSAEGFGALTAGGRGGKVIKVTNLQSSGPGSLQAACSAAGPRIVVFDVSGVISGDVLITEPFITIAGQTSPGGVTIDGMLSNQVKRYDERVRDIVIRFLRIRPTRTFEQGAQGVLRIWGSSQVILDHVSCSWGYEENISLCDTHDATVQWCSIEKPAGQFNFGFLAAYGRCRNLSIHHNLFAHCATRNPMVRGRSDTRNNVIYNFRKGFEGAHPDGGYEGKYNIVANYYKRGPECKSIIPFCGLKGGSYYFQNNLLDNIANTYQIDDPWMKLRYGTNFDPVVEFYEKESDVGKLMGPLEAPPVVTHDPLEAYKLVLEKAGCFPRDIVTQSVIEEVRTRTGRWGRGQIPDDMMKGLTCGKPEKDSDGDGMPDTWEDANGLAKDDPADHSRIMSSGYTAIEEYVNERGDELLK